MGWSAQCRSSSTTTQGAASRSNRATSRRDQVSSHGRRQPVDVVVEVAAEQDPKPVGDRALGERAECVRPRPVGAIASRAVRSRPRTTSRRAGARLLQQPALARACVGDDRQTSCWTGCQDGVDRGQVAFATVHALAVRRTTQHRALARAEEEVGRERFVPALDLQRPDVVVLVVVPGEPVGGLPDDEPAGRRVRLQPLRHVHRVAEDVVVGPDVAGDQPGHHRTGVDTDAQGEVGRLFRRDGEEGRELLEHLVGAAHRPDRVVLVRDGRAEVAEDGVARERPDVALAPLHDPHQAREDRVDDHRERLGVEPTRE